MPRACDHVNWYVNTIFCLSQWRATFLSEIESNIYNMHTDANGLPVWWRGKAWIRVYNIMCMCVVYHLLRGCFCLKMPSTCSVGWCVEIFFFLIVQCLGVFNLVKCNALVIAAMHSAV